MSKQNLFAKYIEDIATGLASWLGADGLIDDFISVLHGVNSEDLRRMISEQKVLDNSVVAKLQAIGTLTDRQIAKLQGMLPSYLTSKHMVKAAQNVQRKIDAANTLRDDVTSSLVHAAADAEQSASDSYEKIKVRRTQTGQDITSGTSKIRDYQKRKEIQNYEKRLSEIQ